MAGCTARAAGAALQRRRHPPTAPRRPPPPAPPPQVEKIGTATGAEVAASNAFARKVTNTVPNA